MTTPTTRCLLTLFVATLCAFGCNDDPSYTQITIADAGNDAASNNAATSNGSGTSTTSTTTTVDAGSDDTSEDTVSNDTSSNDTSTTVVNCAELGPDACIAVGTEACVLEWFPEENNGHRYTCRPPANACERLDESGACGEAEDCLWYAADCYCPEAADCECGGGPWQLCRRASETVTCEAERGWGCASGSECCGYGGEIGVCEPDGCIEPFRCGLLDPEACLEIGAEICVLDWEPYETYTCRSSFNACDRASDDQDSCESNPDCVWSPEECLCVGDALCDCGGGPANRCRLASDPRPCIMSNNWGCSETTTCCQEGPEPNIGMCQESGACGGEVDCAGMQRDACIASDVCILTWSPLAVDESEGYTCRPVENACEALQPDFEGCEAAEGCVWYPDSCYCPENAICGCGGGPPTSCRAEDATVTCQTRGGVGCAPNQQCCGDEESRLGVCQPLDATCDTNGCTPLIDLRITGGLCAFGPCFTKVNIRNDGYVTLNSEQPDTPVDAVLDEASLSLLRGLIADIDIVGLEEGYGTCCNAFSDGSDDYITFYVGGVELRTVRISNNDGIPAPLLALQQELLRMWRERADLETRPAACQTAADLPLDEGDDLTCESSLEAARGVVVWSLAGPNDQHLSRDGIRLDSIDPDFGDPATLVLEGEVVTRSDGVITIDVDGEPWELRFENYPVSIPRFCLVVGQLIRLTARVQFQLGFTSHGLMIEDERGVHFIADAGLSGVHTEATSPFGVAQVDSCPLSMGENDCAPAGAQSLRFSGATGESLELLTGQWGVYPISGGYDLALLNLKSFSSGLCDDYWNYAYVATALAGSDLNLCE